MKTDCYLKDGKSAQECITSHMAELPTECQHLYKSFVECRRGMVSHPLSLPFPLSRSWYTQEHRTDNSELCGMLCAWTVGHAKAIQRQCTTSSGREQCAGRDKSGRSCHCGRQIDLSQDEKEMGRIFQNRIEQHLVCQNDTCPSIGGIRPNSLAFADCTCIHTVQTSPLSRHSTLRHDARRSTALTKLRQTPFGRPSPPLTRQTVTFSRRQKPSI